MTIKIKTMQGYQIDYDPILQRFIALDSEGNEEAFASTQDQIEKRVKSLGKQEFKRIAIVEVRGEGTIIKGQLTSLDRDDKSVWVSMEESDRRLSSGRSKLNLRYDHSYYELTAANATILVTIKAKAGEIKQADAELEALIDTLEKSINLAYFGIEER